jgi:hypothetical protein
MPYFLKSNKRGYFNRYRKGMPLSEMLLKDASILLLKLKAWLKGKKQVRILVYPHFPSRGATIYRIAKHLGLEVTNKIERGFELAIYWEYATDRKEYEVLEQLAKKGNHVINLHHRSISKDVVDEQMQQAFGYSMRIDPSVYHGKAVRKSKTNAVHDGTLVDCPCAPEPGFIYQKFVDSSANENEVMDLRIPIMGQRIPHLYRNYRNKAERFKNVPDRAALCLNIREALTEDEEQQILAFARISKMEYGELDVLRDVHDGLLYIVDANNTPQGPPKRLPDDDKKVAIQSYGKCFLETFILRPPRA